ncbi:unnamed protein product [Urochloa decumbens]|uniref:WRKY domain-containing protein n=1 Tax=Urochloa decumbens TaxID=240449 RepID=A0ABC9HAW7_9POAL
MDNLDTRYLPHCSSTCADKFECFACVDHQPAINEIVKMQSLVAQLRAIVLPACEIMNDLQLELVSQLFGTLQDCTSKVISELQIQYSAQLIDVDRRKLVGNISDCKKGCTKKKYKRSRYGDSTSYMTPVPHYDGHQWRKYGQKIIRNSKHQRSYYRCTYKHEQNCMATKTVQQQEHNTTEPVMYTVAYYGRHACKANTCPAPPHVIETSTPQGAMSLHRTIGTQEAVSPDTDSHKILENEHATPQWTEDVQGLLEKIAFAPLDSDIWEIDAILSLGAR